MGGCRGTCVTRSGLRRFFGVDAHRRAPAVDVRGSTYVTWFDIGIVMMMIVMLWVNTREIYYDQQAIYLNNCGGDD